MLKTIRRYNKIIYYTYLAQYNNYYDLRKKLKTARLTKQLDKTCFRFQDKVFVSKYGNLYDNELRSSKKLLKKYYAYQLSNFFMAHIIIL